jgi:hypothetical protein
MVKTIRPIDDKVAEVDDERAGNWIDPDPIAGGSLHFEPAFVVLREKGNPPPIRVGTGAELVELCVRRLRRVSEQAQRRLLVLEGRVEKRVRLPERERDQP